MALSPFAAILDAARTRQGAAALEARLPAPKTPAELRETPDDRYLSEMSRRIFRAGLKHSLVDAKWPAFEEVFHGFAPRRVRAMSDEALEALLGNARLIRHWGKLSNEGFALIGPCAISRPMSVRQHFAPIHVIGGGGVADRTGRRFRCPARNAAEPPNNGAPPPNSCEPPPRWRPGDTRPMLPWTTRGSWRPSRLC